MKSLITPLLFIATSVPAIAQTENADSIAAIEAAEARELGEVTVEGRTQRVIKFGVEYTPDKKVKKAAIDATRLLSLMQLPQLSVTPGSSDVKTITGDNVAMFIDYVPATSQDLEGLRPEDVLRVEVLDYPDDPRFNSAQHVVNFIMVKYEWGGYTKATAEGATLYIDRLSGYLYSKFVHNKWTFDASGGGAISYDNSNALLSVSHYRDIMFNGTRYDELTRTATTDDFLEKSNSQWASFRASYRTEKAYIQHTVYFNRQATPLTRSSDAVTFSGGILPDSRSYSRESTQSLSPAINGYYFIDLARGNWLNISWGFSHSGTRRNSSYRLDQLSAIDNNNREKSYAPTANISYSKKFSHENTFRTALMTYNTFYNTEYSGSYRGTQKLLSSENMLFLEYMQDWKFGLSLYSRVGASYVVGRVNGVNTLEQWNPRLGFQLQYRINDKHRASLEGWWGNSHPQASSSNTALVQSNELLWLQGNPDLKNTIFVQTTASYTYIPNNRLSLTAAARYEGSLDKQAVDYFSLPGYDGLVRRTINSGDAHDYMAWVSANLHLLDNALTFNATGQIQKTVLTGCDARSATWLAAYAQASYYIGNFSLSLHYTAPGRQLSAWNEGWYYKYGAQYGLYATYALGNLKASLNFTNWFTDSSHIRGNFNSPRFSGYTDGPIAQCGRNLSLTLSYTLPYGKKVSRDDEVGQGRGAGSAILK